MPSRRAQKRAGEALGLRPDARPDLVLRPNLRLWRWAIGLAVVSGAVGLAGAVALTAVGGPLFLRLVFAFGGALLVSICARTATGFVAFGSDAVFARTVFRDVSIRAGAVRDAAITTSAHSCVLQTRGGGFAAVALDAPHRGDCSTSCPTAEQLERALRGQIRAVISGTPLLWTESNAVRRSGDMRVALRRASAVDIVALAFGALALVPWSGAGSWELTEDGVMGVLLIVIGFGLTGGIPWLHWRLRDEDYRRRYFATYSGQADFYDRFMWGGRSFLTYGMYPAHIALVCLGAGMLAMAAFFAWPSADALMIVSGVLMLLGLLLLVVAAIVARTKRPQAWIPAEYRHGGGRA